MLAVKLRREIATAENEAQLVRNINPVISWDDFKPPEGPDKPAELGGLEGDPEWFFEHTYPTSVIKEVLKGIKEKLAGTSVGVYPLDGSLGSGKSHILLTLYHIFRYPSHASQWLQKWNIDFPLVEDAIVIPIPLQSVSYKNLWTPFFKALGVEVEVEEDDWPKLKDVKKAVGDKTVVVLIDEIDNWYDAKDNREKARIRGFLQSLSEASEDPDCRLILVITFLGLSQEVKLLRDFVARPRGGESIVMQRSEDIFDIVRFRLFEDEIDGSKVERVITEYLEKIENELKKIGLSVNSHIKDDLKRAYPFHPAFLTALSSLKVRQMLVMLARLVKRKINEVDLILTSDLDDDLLRAYLHSVDPETVNAYFDDVEFVKSTKEVKEGVVPYDLSRGILLTALLNTIETNKGADIKSIIFGCGTKYTVQDIKDTISFLEKWTRLKRVEEDGTVKYIITTQLPPAVKIERRAELIPHGEDIKIVQKLVKKIVSQKIKGFKLIYDVSEIKNDKRFKILVLLEKPADITSVYPPDFVYKNTLFLLYPGYSLKSDEILKLARRIIASEELGETEEPKKAYSEFREEYTKHLIKQIENAGWRGFRWFRKDLKDKPIPNERTISSLEDVESIIKQYSSKDLLKYFLNLILDTQEEISVRDFKERLYRLEGAPILLNEQDLNEMLAEAVKEGEVAIKTRQGKILFKQSISYQIIGNDDIIIKPPKDEVPPAPGEIIAIVKSKKKLSFGECRESYPFIDDDSLEKIYLSCVDGEEGIYLVEDGRIVTKPRNVKKSVLMTREEAASILEPLVLKLIKEKAAIRVQELLDILKDTYKNYGATEDLLILAADNLEIGKQISILRRKNEVILQLPEDLLQEEIKKRIFFEVKRRGEINKEDLIESILEQIPTDARYIEDALAMLLDDGKVVYDGNIIKLKLPRRDDGGRGLVIPPRRIIIRGEGKAREIVEVLGSDVEDSDIIESAKIEFLNGLSAKELKELLKSIGDAHIRITARRKL